MKKPVRSQLLPSAIANPSQSLLRFATCACLLAGLLTHPAASFGQGDPTKVGKWDPPMKWPNVAIHMHVLPDGKVMFWSRREWGLDAPLPNPEAGRPSLDPHESTPRIWDPENPTVPPVALQSPALRGSPNQ